MRSWSRLWMLTLLAAAILVPPARAETARPAPVQDVRLSGPASVVFQQLGRLYGVRVRVDANLPARPLRLELGQADLPSALRVAALLAGAFWVEQPDGTVLVAEDTPANRAHYQPQMMRTFVLPGRSPEEMTEVVRMLRELLDINRILADPHANTFTVRDTPRRLEVAARLLDQILAEPGEIWLEIDVLEVDATRARSLGFVPPDKVVVQQVAAGAIPLADAGRLGENLQAVLPGTVLRLDELRSAARSTRHLSLRAREGQEATVFVGDQFPVVFATFSSSFISPLEQELRDKGQFRPPVPAMRYEELGVRVRARPRLHSTRELTLEMKIEQKALAGTSLNGIPVLSNRSLEQQVRLREGETLLLAGLRSDERTRTTQGNSPLPTETESSRDSTELLLLVTPRLVRAPVPDRLALRTLYLGTEGEFAPPAAAPAPAVQPVPQPPGVRPPAPPQPPPQPPEEEKDEDKDDDGPGL